MTQRATKSHRETSWEELGFVEYANGIKSSQFKIGDDDDEQAPVVLIGTWPPGATVGPHSHVSDYAEIIIAGSQQVTRRWHHAGGVRIVKGRTTYGPLVAGPEGVTVLIIFRDSRVQTVGLKEVVEVTS